MLLLIGKLQLIYKLRLIDKLQLIGKLQLIRKVRLIGKLRLIGKVRHAVSTSFTLSKINFFYKYPPMLGQLDRKAGKPGCLSDIEGGEAWQQTDTLRNDLSTDRQTDRPTDPIEN